MRRLYIIVEGQTEQEFVSQTLAPHLRDLGIYDITPILIRTSKTGKGGFVNYEHLKNDVTRLLSSEKDIIVSTFVDFFRIPTSVPKYKDSMRLNSDNDKVESLEQGMFESISDRRFIPYIQLHEFEALLFSSNKGFEEYCEVPVYKQTKSIVDSYENPEDINSSPETAPSKRLLKINPDYDKVLEGNLIALKVGINTMLERCPRFREWVEKLIAEVKK
ncbi:DUF4276 family protein [uncultured Bacteroides sp.]|uniref:DUF4276 family protein n=1 Tax=uncultured Bacteroides sp. TaxID=162156 RepID=UPI002AAAFC36|nr:DUF4276 family protein [uncultured Bacteroides sp.]